MPAKASLGGFEHQVLLAVLRLDDTAYTNSILMELEDRTGREVSAAAVYIALRRLEAAGLLRSRLRSGPEGRERRYVRITPAGERLVLEAHRSLTRLWDGLPLLADEGGSR
jgi:DNA-binding PadR family transcriptional regulator